MTKHDPRDVLDWLWEKGLIEAACVYDGRSRWRDAYHGSTHKACVRRDEGYLYNVDDHALPADAIVPDDGLVLTLGYDATRAFIEHVGLKDELAAAIGAASIGRMPEDPDVYVIRF